MKIVRQYVKTPRDSAFANELRILISDYTEKNLKGKSPYDVNRSQAEQTYQYS